MLKNLLSPVQSWLLNQGRCVGCGTPLNKAKKTMHNQKDTRTCKCSRVYVYNPNEKTYRRALLSEV
ncbi:hypothetical protein HY408_01275 [Candidatus Gottesmanbacteria bacterium]|nr:hypothetical protein [Candidatus Gottesmanbacteria bacterium]